jgi:dienelactone hydrolase
MSGPQCASNLLAHPTTRIVDLNGEPVRLSIWFPSTDPPWSGVIRMHGTTESAADLPPWTGRLLETGTVVLSFSARYHGERGPGAEAYRAWLAENPPNHYLRSITGTVRDIVHAAQWLRDQPQVAPDRIGLWGGSLGATCCLAAARFVQPRAISSICGAADYQTVLRKRYPDVLKAKADRWLTPESRRLIEEFDPVLHTEEMPPASLLMVHGDDDQVVPAEGQRALYDLLQPLYRESPDRLALLRHPGGHATPEWCERTAVSWLQHALQ